MKNIQQLRFSTTTTRYCILHLLFTTRTSTTSIRSHEKNHHHRFSRTRGITESRLSSLSIQYHHYSSLSSSSLRPALGNPTPSRNSTNDSGAILLTHHQLQFTCNKSYTRKMISASSIIRSTCSRLALSTATTTAAAATTTTSLQEAYDVVPPRDDDDNNILDDHHQQQQQHPHYNEKCIRVPPTATKEFLFGNSTRTTTQQQQKEDAKKKHDHDEEVVEEEEQQQDYFELFQIPHSFDIDLEQLKQSYRRLMSIHHPDKFSTHHNNNNNNNNSRQQKQEELLLHPIIPSSSSELLWSVPSSTIVLATTITQAYETLKLPYTRAKYLFTRIGPSDLITSNHDELVLVHGNKNINKNTSMNPLLLGTTNFLNEMMEWHELIDEAINNQHQLQLLYQKNQNEIIRTCQNLSQSFHKKDWNHILQFIAQLQYWNRIHDRIKDELE